MDFCDSQEAQPEWGRRGHSPPTRKNLLRYFAGVLYQSQLFEKKREEQSDSCSVISLTDQDFTRLVASGCETMWLKHATLLAKLPINANNTSWGVAWMKCKGAVFLQRSRNTDETLLRGLFAWSIAETNKHTWSRRSVMQQRNGSHRTVGIVASGYAKPGRRASILICRPTASHCQCSTQNC